jgi:type I restriction enzyme, S subunit
MNGEDDNIGLPPGWISTTLGQVLSDIQPGFASGKHTSDGSGLPHLRPMNVTRAGLVDRSDLRSVASELADRPTRRLVRGDVLFNNTNSLELVGKTALFDDDDTPAFSNHMTRLRVKAGSADPAFIALVLHGLWRAGEFQRLANNHVSQASVSQAVLRELPLIIPPVSEQQRIATFAKEIQTRHAATSGHLRSAHTIIERLCGAVLAAGSAGRLTADWRLSHAIVEDARHALDVIRRENASRRSKTAPNAPDARVRAQLPQTWVWASVGEVGTVQLGGTPSRQRPDYWNGSVPWISSGEVANCRIAATRETITKRGLADSNAKVYPPGTVLIAMIGEGKTRGQAAILDIEACTNQNAAAIICDRDLVDPEYVWRWARAQYEVTRSEGRGGNQPALNGQKVRELAIPVPPLEEQREIVRRVDELLAIADRLSAQIDRTAATVDVASQASLSEALRGKLASALIESNGATSR